MIKLVLLFGLVAAACASVIPYPYGWPYNYFGYGYPYHYYPVPYNVGSYKGNLIYYGQFEGSCDHSPDGLYYVDDRSFAYCTNGNKYIQACAEGSANPPLGTFVSGKSYHTSDFCAVNLVAHGYKAYAPHVPYVPAPAPPAYKESQEVHGYKEEKDRY